MEKEGKKECKKDIDVPKYSRSSLIRLSTCHPKLITLFNLVIQFFNCVIVCGYRGEEEQNQLYIKEKTKMPFPDSLHNSYPALAVDAYPFFPGKGVSFEQRQCTYFAGHVKAMACLLGINLRTGADWDGDNDVNDQTFHDICHFELIDEAKIRE